MYTYRGCLQSGGLWSEEDTTIVGGGSCSGRTDRFRHDICEYTVILDSSADHACAGRFGRDSLVVGRKN